MVMIRRDMCCFVAPVLEQFAVRRGIGNQRSRMRAQARKQREFLASYQHVDGVNLDESDSIEHLAKVCTSDSRGWSWSGKPLSCERYASRSGNIKVSRQL